MMDFPMKGQCEMVTATPWAAHYLTMMRSGIAAANACMRKEFNR
jgi:hypothetical protein